MLCPDLWVRTTAPGPECCHWKDLLGLLSSPGTESVCLDRAAGKEETHRMQWLKKTPNISWKFVRGSRQRAWFLMYNQSYTRCAEGCSLHCLHEGSPDGSVGEESTSNAGDPSSIPGSGRSAREGIGYPLQFSWAFLVAQLVKNLPAMPETWVWSMGWENPLEKGKATHSIFRPGEFHGLYNPWGCKELDMTERLSYCMHETKQDAEKLSNMNKVTLANVEAEIQSQVLYLYLHLPKPLWYTAFPSTCKYPEMGC